MKTLPLYQHIAITCDWLKTVNNEYLNQCEASLLHLTSLLPSGSGIDNGIHILAAKSGRDKIIITFDYHFMDEDGYYDGWESYKIIIKPTLTYGFTFKVIGKNRNFIKDYFYQLFDYALTNVYSI